MFNRYEITDKLKKYKKGELQEKIIEHILKNGLESVPTIFTKFYPKEKRQFVIKKGEDWDFTAAALKGSSFYKLPKILQWFSGNIGFHHIHHLSPRIPNYNLERCHRSDPMFADVKPVTLFSSLKLATLRLWDEHAKKLIGFRGLKEARRREREANGEKSAAQKTSRARD